MPNLKGFSCGCLRQAGRKLEILYSEKGGVPVLFTSPYYVQLIDEVRRLGKFSDIGHSHVFIRTLLELNSNANACLWTSQDYRIEYPAAFLLEVAASMTEVLQGPQEVDEGGLRGRIRCISTQLENEVCYVKTFIQLIASGKKCLICISR